MSSKLLEDQGLSGTYLVNIGKGPLGLVLIYTNNFLIDSVLNKNIINELNKGDILIKVDNIDISTYNFIDLVKLCRKISNRKKVIELISYY